MLKNKNAKFASTMAKFKKIKIKLQYVYKNFKYQYLMNYKKLFLSIKYTLVQ